MKQIICIDLETDPFKLAVAAQDESGKVIYFDSSMTDVRAEKIRTICKSLLPEFYKYINIDIDKTDPSYLKMLLNTAYGRFGK